MTTLKTPSILTALFALICLLSSAYLLLLGTGMFLSPTIKQIGLVSIFIIALSSSKKSFWFILMPLVFLHALYTPIGLNFGAPSYQYIASIFSTDILETKEFLLQIPFTSYLTSLAIPLLVFVYYKSAVKIGLNFFRNRTFIVLSMLLVGYYLPIAQPLKETLSATFSVFDEVNRLKNLESQSQWGTSTLKDSRYQDYILIIGESARKDYHHTFGYPIENTPFMSSTKGTLIDGFTSGGTNTVASLRLMLTKPDKQNWQPNYGLSLVDLIKSAGIYTYWLSNQGYLGEYDTPVAALAAKSDEVFFLKKGGSFNSTNYSDFDLLPKLNQIIEQPTQHKRFIVLHLYGSHPLACDRLEDYRKIFTNEEILPKYHYLNCYISSIQKTDEMLQRVYETLEKNYQKTERPFSMIYFADHGLCHQKNEKEILFNQNCFSRLHYQVPLIKISSDDKTRQQYNVFKSGLNFVEGIANWIGIKNPLLDENIDLFSNQSDQNDYGLNKRIQQKHRKDEDPAIDIRPGIYK
ncbi:phosphoethanolamine transferase [Rodentibacter caecimuris]|uniref:Sulfatase N-terminal domain-containing protein n=1 Tax=Rodentibacter caecimuris TaxID=1796644 RepID=A0ABX3KWN9_9PAST|nr:hypothetical protein BKG89_08875 [Rodentibacter heylii]